MMLYSSSEMLGLVAKVYLQQASLVIGKAAKKAGKPVGQFMDAAPEVAKRGLKLTRTLHKRFERGDYRHTEAELAMLEAYCEWLIDTAQTLGGHPVREFKINRASMMQHRPLDRTYAEVIGAVRQL